jgi:putative toxin-antitoxin system antitoxin component (TIGR02293 family)
MTQYIASISPSPARRAEEPALSAAYLANVPDDNPAAALNAMKLIRAGLPTSVIRQLEEAGVERKYRIQIIPERTLQHRVKNGERMTPAESERAYRIANVIALADRVFGNHEKGMRWLHNPMRRLEQQCPLDILDTDIGARLVEEALGQIDAGYFA